jgi:hypothetical protein
MTFRVEVPPDRIGDHLGVNRRIDSIGWGRMPLRWRGRIFDVFLLAVDHITRQVNGTALLLQQCGLHGWTEIENMGRIVAVTAPLAE